MTTTTTTVRKGTVQMLWDCPACGTRKLLGVDHRHCPNCGSPQEENLRYFPSKADRVATEWRALTVDALFIGQVSRLTGELDCDELEHGEPR